MQFDDLIISYCEYRIAKVKAIKTQKYALAAECRDEERKISKEILSLINPSYDSIKHNECEKIIDDWCTKEYNCGIYDPVNCIKTINRIKKIKELGL
jgi:hypothetical protein